MKDYRSFTEEVKEKVCAVIGAGVSNKPLIRILSSAGACVHVFDKKPQVKDLDMPDEVVWHVGEDYLADLPGLGAGLIFRSPGVKPFEKAIEQAIGRGSSLTSEMEVFLDICPCPVYGVTGSDGKTTTTTLLKLLLETTGKRVWLGGNIGTPLLEKVPEMRPDDLAVLELSSFQLMTMKKSPLVSVITNLSPNHLDWHRDMDEYVSAKLNIARYRPPGGRLIMNADDPLSRETAERYGLKPEWFSKSEPPCDPGAIKIPGTHNVENYCAAAKASGVSRSAVEGVAKSFGGVAHRLEFVRELDGVKYYNDSIASSPTRTIAGLKVFGGNVILLAGGRPKVPFGALAEVVGGYAKTVLAFGEAAGKIAEAFAGKIRAEQCGAMESAVLRAREIAAPGDVVLLSPSCTSFDAFKNFEERGDMFKRIVGSF